MLLAEEEDLSQASGTVHVFKSVGEQSRKLTSEAVLS